VEKLELQRGLQQQSEIVERLAAEHQDATERFQAVADERAKFQKELRECQAVLAAQVWFLPSGTCPTKPCEQPVTIKRCKLPLKPLQKST
jgi:hypothetical protein